MKILKTFVIVLSLAVMVAGCGGAPAPAQPAAAPAAASSGGLVEDYPDALSVRNQLAFGTLRLEGTANAVTAAEAAKLAPLWQALKTLAASSTSATEEVIAVQNQISAAMTPAQISAIAGLKLTNAMLQAYYVEIGVSVASTPEPGVTPQSGSLKDLPPEQREAAKATAQAQGTPVGGGIQRQEGCPARQCHPVAHEPGEVGNHRRRGQP
ncbi:hypothetical protein [Candidatus Amarolinea dominans]|uniref:hypothetical protein n=1 Tax=Candidatus Amarolinea dominans TaxID=3140696 RepID=UPI003134A563|nr:hypothetical protein [Anaerolineae bacterium]